MIDSLDEFIDEFERRMEDAQLSGKVRVELSATNTEHLVSLDLIETDPEHRGQGLGTRALNLIGELADKCGFAVQVIPKNLNGPMDDENLAAWYTRHSFRVSTMRRDPKHAED
jgi:GNAT superfamily N-acetyltransferase